MDPASTVIRIAAALALIGINGYFVAARSAFLSVRRSRLEAMARGGDTRAQRLLEQLDAPESQIAAAELAAVVAKLGVGWIAHGMLRDVAVSFAPPSPALEAGLAIVVLLLAIVLHSTLGVQVPRLLTAHDPERMAVRTFGMTRMAAILLAPLAAPASAIARALAHLFGATAASAAGAAEEIRLLVEQSPEADQEQMLLGVYHLRDTLAREVMTPRRDIVALSMTASRDETLALVAEEGHSRIPVYGESIDDITGVLLVKDLLIHLMRDNPRDAEFDLRTLVREPYFVPDTKRIGELLPELRTKSVHMAIVLDEFGGTEGLVTLEDMLEEIVGDIYDEHDIPEETDFEITDTGDVLIDGGASIFDVNERFGLHLPEDDYDTIGGFVFGELGRVPVAGDEVSVNGTADLVVDEVEERRVTRVRLIRHSEPIGGGSGRQAVS